MAETTSITQRPAWQALSAHYRQIKDVHLRTLFAQDPQRGERFTAEAVGLYLDYSKHRITDETLRLLLNLAAESGLRERIDAMFRGDKINITENRAVLHVALRAPRDAAASSSTARMSCRKCTPCWTRCPTLPSACAAASGRGTPASASATSSTSASAARTSARSWPTRPCATTRIAT